MFYKLIEKKRDEWLSSPDCTVKDVIRYIEKRGKMRDAQIEAIGGGDELLRRVRIWLQIVEQRTNKRPILYVSQMFINKYMANADDIKKHYNVWIARYGEYKPDVKLVYWQLCPDGRVNGINTLVDINVFNGYQMQFDEFVRTGFHQ